MRKLRAGGIEPRVVIEAENLSPKEASLFEQELISKYGRRRDGGVLTNIGRGGEGNTSNHKRVDMYDLYGNYERTFESLLAAARYCGKENSSAIVECCNHSGKSKSGWGHLWSYNGVTLDLEWCWSNSRPVRTTCLITSTEVCFPSATKAAKEVAGSPALITKACRNSKPYKNRLWSFV